LDLRIGTSGYSYEAWRGGFYPPGLQGSGQLSYYATSFPVVELNGTYYGMPLAAKMARMVERTPEGFEFTVKAHQDLTHAGSFIRSSFAQFREAMEPLREAGRLGCVLAQFPHSFNRSPANEDFLKRLPEELPELPVVVEFRNNEWVTDRVFERLRDLSLGFCCVDEPRLKGLVPPIAVTTSRLGYIRFHGRNAAKWNRHDTPSERYDYLYSRDELAEWLPGIHKVAAETEKTYVFFNNCHSDQAPRNAWMMAELLDVALPRQGPIQPRLDLFD
jgi:uncharacterized protein YecE (DUF72 family)